MPQVKISDEARADLDQIWLSVAQHNLPAADRLIDTLFSKFGLLASQPLMGSTREHLAPGLRGLPVGNYVIFYRPAPNGVGIVRVLHGARDLPALF